MPVMFPNNLSELDDVDAAGLGEGKVLAYDASSGTWQVTEVLMVTGTPSDGDVVTYDSVNGAQWEAPVPGTGGSSDAGVQVGDADAATSTIHTVVVGDSVAHTKGAWVELIASTSFDAETLILDLVGGLALSGNNSATLLDIGFGAAASEVVKIANIAIGFTRANITKIIPFDIPAGTRISARLQSAITSKSINIMAQVRAAGDHSAAPTVCTTYGANTATSSGPTAATPGGVHTESAWVEITASTTADISRLLVDITAVPTSGGVDAEGMIDIATGGSGSESVLIPDIGFYPTSAEVIFAYGIVLPYAVNIPTGTRLSFRYQSSSVSAGGRPSVVLHGFT